MDKVVNQGKGTVPELNLICQGMPTVVIDFGSGFTKAGISGEDAPTITFPTVIGRSRARAGQSEPLVGLAAITNAGQTLKRPVQRGVINMDELELLSTFIYEQLDIKADSASVLLSRPSNMSPKQMEALARHFFEQCHVPGLAIVSSATLALLGSGRCTGLIAEVGYGVMNVVPIFESFGIEHARITEELGGSDVDVYLAGLLRKLGKGEIDAAAVQEVKEQLCYVRTGTDPVESVPYELPSGEKLEIGEERVSAPEILFQPRMAGKANCLGLAEAIVESVHRCDEFLRGEILPNIVLSGGSTMFPGMADRVRAEVVERLEAKHISAKGRVNVISAPERKYGVWVGGSIFGGTTVYPVFLMKKGDLDAQGAQLFRQKSYM